MFRPGGCVYTRVSMRGWSGEQRTADNAGSPRTLRGSTVNSFSRRISS